MTHEVTSQLNLDVSIYPPAHISDFVGVEWTAVLDAIRQLSVGLLNSCYFYGESGSGKSHLLVALCTLYRDMNKKAIYLPMHTLLDDSPEILYSLEEFNFIAIDDVHLVSDSQKWQEAIFHLYNKSLLGDCQLVLVSDVMVSNLNFTLKDLLSRLAQCTSFALPKLDLVDNRKQTVENILSRRNLVFNKNIIEYLFNQGPTKTSLIISVVDELQLLSPEIGHKKLKKAIREQAEAIITRYTELDKL